MFSKNLYLSLLIISIVNQFYIIDCSHYGRSGSSSSYGRGHSLSRPEIKKKQAKLSKEEESKKNTQNFINDIDIFSKYFDDQNQLEIFKNKKEEYDEILQKLTDEQKQNLLDAAIYYKKKNAVLYLLSKCIDPKVQSKNGNNSFHLAAFIDDADILKLLLSHKENQISKITGLPTDICKITTKYTEDFLDLQNESTQTALDIAADKKNIEAMRALLLNGAQLTSSAIILAKENPKLMDIISNTIENNITPVNSVFPKYFGMLFADPTISRNITPLMLAAYTCNTPLALSLIKAKADINAQSIFKFDNKDYKTLTPLMFAIINKCYDIEKILLEAGANPNIVSSLGIWRTRLNFEGQSALTMAAYALDFPSIKILLSSPKIDINAKNWQGDTIFDILQNAKNSRIDQLPQIEEILEYLDKFKTH